MACTNILCIHINMKYLDKLNLQFFAIKDICPNVFSIICLSVIFFDFRIITLFAFPQVIIICKYDTFIFQRFQEDIIRWRHPLK